jgi:hypothetical protein
MLDEGAWLVAAEGFPEFLICEELVLDPKRESLGVRSFENGPVRRIRTKAIETRTAQKDSFTMAQPGTS